MTDSDFLIKVLEWGWLGLIAVLTFFWRKVTLYERQQAADASRIALLEQRALFQVEQRGEDREHVKNQVAHVLAHMDAHHSEINRRLDAIERGS